MPDTVDYLILAFRLSVLTFYLGVLVYALPIPWEGLKRWAPRLIGDSIFASALILSFELIMSAADWITSLAGGSWEYFELWLAGGYFELFNIKQFVILVQSLPNVLPFMDALKQAVRPLDRLATSGLFFLAFLAGLKYLLSNYGQLLAALGLVLYATPFRVGRAAGAWLFSFAIVFTIGLQVLPVFVTSFLEPPEEMGFGTVAALGIAFARVQVSSPGGPLEGELWVLNTSEDAAYGVYQVEDGVALDKDGNDIITTPGRPPLVYKLVYMNVTFTLTPYPVSPDDYDLRSGVRSIELASPYTIYGRNGVLAYTNGNIISAEDTEASVTATVHLEPGQYVAVRYPSRNCWINIDADGLQLTEQGSWEWRSVEGVLLRFTAPEEGNYTVSLWFSCQVPDFDYERTDYVGDIASHIFTFYSINFIKAFFLYWFTIPIIYLGILASITLGLARTLGGRERLPLRVF